MSPAAGSRSRDRDFAIFWLVQTLSVGGASFSYVAIPLLVLEVTGSVGQMGLITGVSGVAALVAGVFAGVLVDRVDRRSLLIWCDAVRALLYALIPLVWLASPRLWLLYLVMPLGSAVAMVFQVGYVSVLPSLVPAARITQANGRLYASYAAAAVVGPMLAGGLSALLGPAAAIGVDAGTFAVSALGLCLVRLRPPVRSPDPARTGAGAAEPVGPPVAAEHGPGGPEPDRPRPGAGRLVPTDLLVGARFLGRQPVLRALTGRLALLTFLTFGLTDLYVYHLRHGLGRSEAAVGYVLATAALGTVVAALLVAPARRRFGFGVCWIGAFALAGTGIALLGAAGDPRTVAALAALVVFGTSLAGICSVSLRQEITPDPLLGRVTSAFWTIHTAPGPLGAAFFTATAARWGTPLVFLLIGGGCLLVTASAVRSPIGRARPSPVPHRPGGGAVTG